MPVQYQTTIKDLPVEERPREKLWRLGSQFLSTSELLAILLRTGFQGMSALQLAEYLLAAAGGLRGLLDLTVEELSAYPGIGMAKAAQIKAALELSRRLAVAGLTERPVVKSPADVARLVMEEMRHYDREHIKAVLLNSKNAVLAVETVHVGSVNSSLVHPREVFKAAIRRSAAALILVHNHPSGDPHPSREDEEVTRRFREAGELLGIDLLDHIIIGDGCYYSFREKSCLLSAEK